MTDYKELRELYLKRGGKPFIEIARSSEADESYRLYGRQVPRTDDRYFE